MRKQFISWFLRPYSHGGNCFSSFSEELLFFCCFCFQIPVLQTNSGPSLTGLTTIAAHLVKQANKEHLLGRSAEEKAVVQQWLEFRVTRVDGQSSKDDIRTVLKVWQLPFRGWKVSAADNRDPSSLLRPLKRLAFFTRLLPPESLALCLSLPPSDTASPSVQPSAPGPLPQPRPRLPVSKADAGVPWWSRS